MSPAEHGAALALAAPPLTDQQIEAAARLLAANDVEADAA